MLHPLLYVAGEPLGRLHDEPLAARAEVLVYLERLVEQFDTIDAVEGEGAESLVGEAGEKVPAAVEELDAMLRQGLA